MNCCVVPAAIEGFAGVTAIDTSSGSVTVSVVELLIVLLGGLTIGAPGVTRVARPKGVVVTQVAVIVVLPGATLLARPAALIVATPGAEELQATEAVRFCVLALL